MERRFIITNVSGERGKVRVTIPFGGPSALPPGRTSPRHARGKKGRYSMVVPESKLRNLIGFIRRGQLRVVAQDGGSLPDWMLFDVSTVAPEELPIEPVALVEAEELPTEETPTGSYDPGLLDGNVGDVAAVLASVTDASYLAYLLEVEESGKARKSALKAIQARMEDLHEE